MVKVDAGLRPFSGAKDNFQEFWRRFGVVAKCQKLTTGRDPGMGILPLYLTGDAFLMLEQLTDSDQEDEDKVKARSKESTFSSSGVDTQFTRKEEE